MTLTEWFSLACILMLGAVSPGPSLALVIRNTSRSGPVTGLLTAIGHGAGVALYALATAFSSAHCYTLIRKCSWSLKASALCVCCILLGARCAARDQRFGKQCEWAAAEWFAGWLFILVYQP
ncbi:hypothetical protein PCI56_16355 [Plesiomonas shigelloides subsp. oncorhynchi]|nr:hypothetical protein [Plesiomonas shigelloides]